MDLLTTFGPAFFERRAAHAKHGTGGLARFIPCTYGFAGEWVDRLRGRVDIENRFPTMGERLTFSGSKFSFPSLSSVNLALELFGYNTVN